jgi:hypothetical protein
MNRCRARRCCPSWYIVIALPTPWRRSVRLTTENRAALTKSEISPRVFGFGQLPGAPPPGISHVAKLWEGVDLPRYAIERL